MNIAFGMTENYEVIFKAIQEMSLSEAFHKLHFTLIATNKNCRDLNW